MKKEIDKDAILKLNYEMHLDVLLLDSAPIIGNEWKIGELEKLLNNIEDNHPEILQTSVFKVKDAIQIEAEKTWYNNNAWGLLAMATGTGKSKIPINILDTVYHQIDKLPQVTKVLLIVPTEKLRDENWKDEFTKWGCEDIYSSCVQRTCYASLDNIKDQEYDLVIGDEWHNFTEAKMPFFRNNKVHRLICLTATPPNPDKDILKIQLNKTLSIKTIYEVPLDIAVRLKLVAPYDVTIVECRLDDITKNVVGGTKDKPFMTTEKQAYDYKTKLVNTAMYSSNPTMKKVLKFRILDRMRFLKNLDSLAKNTIFILNNFIKPDERTLIFCGGIPQANKICQYTFHSETNDRDFENFKNKKISRLACVSALNEGHNIDDIETIVCVCPESGDKTITQQIGRGVRFAVGHRCRVIIIIVTDTVSEKWMDKAIINLDKSKFRRVRFANLINNVETI